MPKEACQKAWDDRGRKITARMLCAGEMDKKSPAAGDSGGKSFFVIEESETYCKTRNQISTNKNQQVH